MRIRVMAVSLGVLRTQTVGPKTQSRTLMSDLNSKFGLLKEFEVQVRNQSEALRKRELQTQQLLQRVQRSSAKMTTAAR